MQIPSPSGPAIFRVRTGFFTLFITKLMFDHPSYAKRTLNIAVAYLFPEVSMESSSQRNTSHGVTAMRAASKGISKIDMGILNLSVTRKNRPT